MKNFISLPNSNLYLDGVAYDAQGNSNLLVKFLGSRAFSIPMVNNLPKTNFIVSNFKYKHKLEYLKDDQLLKISNEVCAFIKQHGSEYQKANLKTGGSAKLVKKEDKKPGGYIFYSKTKTNSSEPKKVVKKVVKKA